MSGSVSGEDSSQPHQPADNGKCRRSKRIAAKLKGNPSKFLKMEDETRASENSFSQALKDCWLQFFDQLKNPNDVLALRNASTRFNDADVLSDTRKRSALWSLAIPILLKRGTLSNKGSLACRNANQEVKAAVDNALIGTQPTWLTNAYSFTTVDTIHRFVGHFDRATGNPFITMQCHVRVSDVVAFERSVELFTNHGQYLHTLNFGMAINQSCTVLNRRLAQLLTLIPSVKSLELGLRGFDPVQLDEIWMMDMLLPGPMPVLPPLNYLTTLKVYRISEEPFFPLSTFRELVQVSWCRLNRFICEDTIFRNLNWMDSGTVRHLELLHFNPTWPDIQMIRQIQSLKLESLYLSGQHIQYNHTTVNLLNGLKNTLEELRMDHLVMDMRLSGLDPRILREFPKLKRLTVCKSLKNSELWHVFRIQFVNLKHLRFESRVPEIARDETVPSADLRSILFYLFCKLKTITWVGHEREIVFENE